MTAPVEHHAASSEAPADVPTLPVQRPGGVLPESVARVPQQAQPVRPAVPAERRGKTSIPERVVSRIAARAAGEVAGVREVRERGPLTFAGRTHATVDENLTAVELDVSVEYPVPLRQVSAEIRRHVADRVRALTGLNVSHIDINMTSVVLPRGEGRR
ncbi:Asp23/Gls24 family envelope stress response protein [Streptosporangium sp. NPDC000396]|uniref:Asp23/Gls24 family envelope stress response protein n=1 Tax=Streptosporangium sp. NPDC000396 TaxID=3366185 RepID=UPI0036B46416